MFRRKDYWPYMFGMFIFGGLLVLPALLERVVDLGKGYDRNLALSVGFCTVFALAHKRNGKLSFINLIGGIALMIFASLQVAKKTGTIQIVIPGLLSFLLLWGCGWLGIIIARVLGISKALVTPASQTEAALDYSVDMGGINTPMDVKSIDLTKEPDDSPFIKFMTSSHNNWKQGKLDGFSTPLRVFANLETFEKFCTVYKFFYGHINTAHKLRPFDEEEYLIPSYNRQFLMTSKAIYFFDPANIVILKKDISQYEIKNQPRYRDGKDMYFTLQSGKKFAFKKIKDIAEKKYVDYFIKMTDN
jgi:hypothetical protein